MRDCHRQGTTRWLLMAAMLCCSAAPARAQIPADPLAFWKLDETGSAVTAADSSGHGNDATLVNQATPGWTTGKINGGLRLDQATDYLLRAGATTLRPAQFAISAWVNTSSTTNGEVASMGDSYSLRVRFNGTVMVSFFVSGTTWRSSTSTVTVNNGSWHHIFGQYDKTNGRLEVYVDGTQSGAPTSTTENISYTLGQDFFLGEHGNGKSGYNFNGTLDQVRVYDHALSPTEIASLATEGGTTSFTVLTWNLRKGRATNNADAIATNMTADWIASSTDADVLLLSAVENSTEADAIKNRLNALAFKGGGWQVFWKKAADTRTHEGQAILTHFDMPSLAGDREQQVIQCANATEDQIIVKAKIVINGVAMSFFAIDQQHGSLPDVRACQAAQMRDWANQRPAPRIVGGDFNAAPGDKGIETWINPPAPQPATWFDDGWAKAPLANRTGYPAEGASQGNPNTVGRTLKTRIDHILLNKDETVATVASARVWDARQSGTTCNDVNLSDGFLGAACSGDCSTCQYVDDKAVRPTDHIPLTVTFVLQ